MLTMPKFIERIEQPYVAITAKVTMREIGPSAETSCRRCSAGSGQRGIAPAGAPFFKYNVIDMERQLEIEFGVPTSAVVAGDTRVHAAGCRRGATRRWCTAAPTTGSTMPTLS
jgi:hypothetical protein